MLKSRMFLIRVFILPIVLSLYLFAGEYIPLDIQNSKEKYILDSLDINELFLQDPVYMDMKQDINRKRKKYHLSMLETNKKFAIQVLNILKEDPTIPPTIVYLAMAESKFDLTAKSHTKASGIWQFMPRTATRFNLLMNEYVDERFDMLYSTGAAVEYLKYLHSIFDKWYLALMAYNCGEGKLKKVIKQVGSDELSLLLVSSYLPKETKMHIRKIVAMSYFNHEKLGDDEYLSRVELKGGTSIYDIANSIGLDVKYLRTLNPQLKYSFLPPLKKYHVYIPKNKISAFKKNFKVNKKSLYYYIATVQDGDSLYALGQKYDVDYKIIKDFNDLKSNIIHKGDKLVIPTISISTKYVIKSGDTLGEISRMYNVKLDKLMKINGLKNSLIRMGQELVIPIS